VMSVRSKVVIRKSRRGNVIAVAREHYLRDDIGCGSALCRTCQGFENGTQVGSLGALSSTYVIPDARTTIDQTDLVLSGIEPFCEVLFLRTVLDEIRATSMKTYHKVSDALKGESENANYGIFSNEHHRQTFVERQDDVKKEEYTAECVKVAAEWLCEHWRPIKRKAALLTNRKYDQDMDIDGLQVCKIRDFVAPFAAQHPRLSELLTTLGNDDDDVMEGDRPATLFPSYLADAEAKRQVKSGKLFQGTFSANPYNRLEGNVSAPMDPKDSNKRTRVLIQGRWNMNRSVEGDVVIVELLPRNEWKVPSNLALEEGDSEDDDGDDAREEKEVRKQAAIDNLELIPTGKVVAIARRNWRPFGGSIDSTRYFGGDSALFIPAERSIPKIRIRSRRAKELMNRRLQVVIDSWNRNSVHPSGHVVREIGPAGDVETETELLLMENDIPVRKFSEAAMGCLPSGNWTVTEENLKNRWDLREKCICSVDPPGCTDIDDALHCVEVEKGVFEVGVHIADVTAFLRYGSTLDMEALERGTTVYLVDRRIEMLPSLLTSNLCSLRGNVERLAFSVLFRMDAEANELSVEFGRSVIKSARAMTYQEAQERIDAFRKDKKPATEVDAKIAASLCGLAALAAKLRRRREEAGALSLASPEVKFKYQEETHEITDVQTYEIRETNRMVEEFMLLANIAVAKKLLRNFPHCALLRRHPKPLPEQFESLLKTANSFGVEIDVSTSKSLNQSLNKAERRFKKKDSYLGTLLRILTTRCMTQAVYFSSGEVSAPEYIHYGLAAPVYTHFTSPIRRYADVIVHRLLSSSLGYSALPEALQNSRRIQEMADVVNVRHRCAQYAARASISLHTTLFLQGKLVEEEARVIRLLKNAVVVLVPKFGVEGVAYVDPLSHKGGLQSRSSFRIKDDGITYGLTPIVHLQDPRTLNWTKKT